MSNIKIIDKHRIQFWKPEWSEDALLDAECLEMTVVDGNIIADIRVTWKRSVGGFMKKHFPFMYVTNRAYMNGLKAQLRKMYSDEMNKFYEVYKNSLDYSHVGKELRNYQKEIIYRTSSAKSRLLALDMGTGKTLISSTIARLVRSKRTNVICPALVKYNWLEDMCHVWGFDEVTWTILEPQERKSIRAIREKFVVVNYENIEKYRSYLNSSEISMFIVDECHAAKNTSTAKHKNLHKLFKENPSAKIVLLSGTPITKRVEDLFSYLKLCDHPLGRNKARFLEMYALMEGTKVVGVKNVDDLNLKISNFMIRLKSEDVLDLPALNIQKRYFQVGELDNEYNEIIENLKKMKQEYDEETDPDKKKDFKLMANVRTSISKMSRLVAMSKVPAIVDWANQLIEQGEKVVIFSSWRSVLEELEKYFRENSVRIDGSVPAKERMGRVNMFVKDSSIDVFLGQVKAAGVGVNLVNARYVMMVDVPISPDLIEQPIKRCHRSGQTRPVFATFAIARGTIDERIYSIVSSKAGDINAIVDANTKNGVIDYSDIPEMLFKELVK